MAKVRVLREQETGRLVTVCRTRNEFEAACAVHCSGFREDNALVTEHDTNSEDCPPDVLALLEHIESNDEASDARSTRHYPGLEDEEA